MKSKQHKFWHYLLMVVVSEVVNLVWLGVGIATVVSGYVIYQFSVDSIYILGLGMPLVLIGLSLILFKLYELVQVLGPSRIESICTYCSKKPD